MNSLLIAILATHVIVIMQWALTLRVKEMPIGYDTSELRTIALRTNIFETAFGSFLYYLCTTANHCEPPLTSSHIQTLFMA